MTLNRTVFLVLTSLFCTALLTGCNAHHSKSRAFDSEDVYSANLPTAPRSTVMVYAPMAEHEEIFEFEQDFDEDYIEVKFSTHHKYENSANFHIVPKQSNFSRFNRHCEKLVLKQYAHHPDMRVTQIYQEETKLDNHPAFYNVYTVEPTGELSNKIYKEMLGEYHEIYKEPHERQYELKEIEDQLKKLSESKMIVMQYVVNYKYHYADIRFIAHTHAKHHPIWSERTAISNTYMPAYEYFRSFRFSYDIDETKEEKEEAVLNKVNSKVRL